MTSVSWSPDGKRVFAWDFTGKVLAWDAVTGQPADAANPPPRPKLGPVRSPDGWLTAKPDGFQVAVVDLRRPTNDNAWPLPDEAERLRYDNEKAVAFETSSDWFSAAFHCERLLLDQPWDASLHLRLAHLSAKQDLRERAVLYFLRGVLLDPNVPLQETAP